MNVNEKKEKSFPLYFQSTFFGISIVFSFTWNHPPLSWTAFDCTHSSFFVIYMLCSFPLLSIFLVSKLLSTGSSHCICYLHLPLPISCPFTMCVTFYTIHFPLAYLICTSVSNIFKQFTFFYTFNTIPSSP